MALGLVLIAAGALILYAGVALAAGGVVRAASALGIGALGTLLIGMDLEALAVALTAAGRGDTEIAAGAAFGAALFLVAVGLGWSLARRQPIQVPSTLVLLAPAGAVILAALAISDRHVDRTEGLLLVIGYAGYLFLVLRERDDRAHEDEEPEEAPVPEPSMPESSAVPGRVRAAAAGVLGIGLLYAGAWLLVEGGARLSLSAGLTAGFVGAVVGALTRLDAVLPRIPLLRPEIREPPGRGVFGAVAALTTVVPGMAALVRPLTLDTGVNLAFLAVAFLYTTVAVALLWRGSIGRVPGAVLLGFYAAWLVYAAGA